MRTIGELTAAIRENNINKGFRVATGGPGDNTWGDYVALLHSEVAEILEAYRDWRLEDPTYLSKVLPDGSVEFQKNPKPRGVGSELADCVIRLLDMADVFGVKPFEMDLTLADVSPAAALGGSLRTFGDWNSWLHRQVSNLWTMGHQRNAFVDRARGVYLATLLRSLAAFAEEFDLDMNAETERKIAYNATRPFQHGGRTLAGPLDTFRIGA